MLTTPRGFRYPELADTPDVPRDIGNLASDADGQVVQTTLALRPAAGKVGRVHYATDTDTFSYDNGTAWIDSVHKSYQDFTVGRQLLIPVADVTAGIKLGGDTQLYRSAAGDLRTPGRILVDGNLIAKNGASQQISIGDTGGNSNAAIAFGSASDTRLYRSAAGVVKTDGSFVAVSHIYAEFGAASQTEIGAIGPGSESGIMLGSLADTRLYRVSAGVLQTDGAIYAKGVFYANLNLAQQVGISGSGAIVFGLAQDTQLVRAAAGVLSTQQAPIGATTVTTLPAAPVDQQECYFLADATNGVVWHLRYRAGSGSAYKWEVLGGPPLYAAVDTNEAVNNGGVFGDIATVGPAIVTPLAGDYDVRIGAYMHVTTNGGQLYMAAQIGAAAIPVTDYATISATTVQTFGTPASMRRKTAVASGTSIKAKYASGSATTVDSRTLTVMPVRVG